MSKLVSIGRHNYNRMQEKTTQMEEQEESSAFSFEIEQC